MAFIELIIVIGCLAYITSLGNRIHALERKVEELELRADPV